jgi:EAL domain-containing protein (putative c-di-GMP-specific phosphodiesterase class I)
MFRAVVGQFGVQAVEDVAPGPDDTGLILLTPEAGQEPLLDDPHALEIAIRAELERLGTSDAIVSVAYLQVNTAGSGVLRETVQAWLSNLREEVAVTAPGIALRQAVSQLLRGNGLSTLFQPIVRVESGQVVGYEALSRGQLGGTTESPPELLAAARQAGLERELDLEMARLALRRAQRFLRDPQLLLFVNLGAPTLLSGLRSLMAESDGDRWPWSQTVLELTERSPITDIAAFARERDAARRRGLRFALDDAGAGYAGLATLALLAPEFIKVDMALVRNCHRQPIKQKIIDSLVYLARQTQSTVIAEGVETRAELETIRSLGVQLAQGYLFAHPSGIPHAVSLPGRGQPWTAARGERIDALSGSAQPLVPLRHRRSA